MWYFLPLVRSLNFFNALLTAYHVPIFFLIYRLVIFNLTICPFFVHYYYYSWWQKKNSWCQFCINLSIVLLKRIIKGDWYLICNCYSSHTIIILMSIASYTAVNTSTSCSHTYVRYPWVFVCIYFWEIYYINFIKKFKNSYIANAPRR